MPVWPIVLAALVALLAGLIILPVRQLSRIKKRVRQTFGKAPKEVQGLACGERYLRALDLAAPWPGQVDEWTWHDLDGDEVFARMNGCHSAVGDAALYCALRRPCVEGGPPPQRRQLAALAEENAPLREKLQYRLALLGRYGSGGLEMAAFYPRTLVLHRHRLFGLMALLPLLCPLLFLVDGTLAIVALAGALILNLVVCNLVKSKNEASFSSVRYVASTLACAGYLAGLLRRDCPEQAQALQRAARGLSGMRLGILLLNLNHRMEESLGFDPLSIFMLPLLGYGTIVYRLIKSGGQVQGLFEAVGEVDLCCAVAGLRASLPGWCEPAFSEAPRMAGRGIYHPLIAEPVANDAVFERDVLFTGSNASGKSTFIKALALNCLCAQSIGTCFAERFELKRGGVATSMAVADSVVDGDSYFVAEIKSMRRLVKLAENGFHYFFIDEILKGTNTVERVAASCAVLRLLQGAPCLCFAATHDIELTEMLAALYDNRHFRETVAEAGVFFDYRLHDGPAATRNAILLLERMDFPAAVTAEARGLVEHFEAAGEWLEADAP